MITEKIMDFKRLPIEEDMQFVKVKLHKILSRDKEIIMNLNREKYG